MSKRILLLIVPFLLLTKYCFASADKPSSAPKDPTVKKEEYDPKKVWLAAPTAYLIGFGLGHSWQNRMQTTGWKYTVVDGVGLALLFSAFGDCGLEENGEIDHSCEDRKTQIRQAAVAILITSRIVQIIDTAIWSYNYKNRYSTAMHIVPKNDGAVLTAVLRF